MNSKEEVTKRWPGQGENFGNLLRASYLLYLLDAMMKVLIIYNQYVRIYGVIIASAKLFRWQVFVCGKM